MRNWLPNKITMNPESHRKESRNFQYPLIIISLDSKNIKVIYMIPKTLQVENSSVSLTKYF